MVHPDDIDLYRRMTGDPSVPQKVAIEYEQWLKLKHLAGSGGALGVIMMVALLRHLGITPRRHEEVQPAPASVDWSRVQNDTPLVVEVPAGESENDEPLSFVGGYRGMIDAGLMSVFHPEQNKCLPVLARHARLATAVFGEGFDMNSMRSVNDVTTLEGQESTITASQIEEITKKQTEQDWSLFDRDRLVEVVNCPPHGTTRKAKFLEYHPDDDVITVLLGGKGTEEERTKDVPAEMVTPLPDKE